MFSGKFSRYFVSLLVPVLLLMPATAMANPNLSVPSSSTTGNYSISVSSVYSWSLKERPASSSSWTTVASGYLDGSVQITGRTNGSYYYKVYNCYPMSGGCGDSATKKTVVSIPIPKPAAPSLTAPTTDNDGNFSISWTTVTNATHYSWFERFNSESWQARGSTSTTSRSVTGRTDGVWSYRAIACNQTSYGKACSGYSSIKTVKVAKTPGIPPSITNPGTNDGDFSISWGSSTGNVASYQLQRQKNSGSWEQIYSGTNTSRTISNLSAGTYRHRVRACNNVSGYEPCSGWRYSNNTTVAAPSSSPTISLASTDNNGSYTVSWGTQSNTSSYKLQEKVGSGSWSTIQNTSSTSRNISGKGNNSYSYRVAACNDIGCASYSGTKVIHVALTPGTPSSITTPGTNDGDYTISWGAASGSITSYKLYYQKNDGSWSHAYTGTSRSKTLSGLSAGTYKHKVIACKTVGSYENCSGERISGNTSVAAPASKPSLTVAASDGDGTYTISWSTVSNITYYELEQNINGGGFSQAQNNSSTSKAYSGQSSARYGYKVRACNNIGCTAYTDPKYINVAVQPGVPGSISAPSTSDGTHSVSWSTATGVVGYYQVYYQKNGNSDWILGYTGASTSANITIQSAGTYTHRVRACVNISGNVACSGYRTSSSTTQVIKPVELSYKYDALGRLIKVEEDGNTKTGYCYDAAGNRKSVVAGNNSQECSNTPPAPTGLSFSSHTGAGYKLTWNLVPGATSYVIACQGTANVELVAGTDEYYTPGDTLDQWPCSISACILNECSAFSEF